MFLFSDAKVRRFSHTSQIYQQQIIKIFPFIDINQNIPSQNGRFEACKVFLYKERFKKVWVVFLCFVYLQAKHYNIYGTEETFSSTFCDPRVSTLLDNHRVHHLWLVFSCDWPHSNYMYDWTGAHQHLERTLVVRTCMPSWQSI